MVNRTFQRSVISIALVILSVIFIVTMGCGSEEKEEQNTQDGGGTSSHTDETGDTADSDVSTPSMDGSTDTEDDSAVTGGGGTGIMDGSPGEDVSNGGTDDTADSGTSGSGGGEAGSGGAGGDEATGGTGGTDDTPLMCNGEVCEAPSGSMLTPCCVEDGDVEVCGGRLNNGCLPWEMGGELDATCPDYEYRTMLVLEGCCTPDGMCGVWSTQGLECIERTDLDEYLGVEELPARECGIVDEDAGA